MGNQFCCCCTRDYPEQSDTMPKMNQPREFSGHYQYVQPIEDVSHEPSSPIIRNKPDVLILSPIQKQLSASAASPRNYFEDDKNIKSEIILMQDAQQDILDGFVPYINPKEEEKQEEKKEKEEKQKEVNIVKELSNQDEKGNQPILQESEQTKEEEYAKNYVELHQEYLLKQVVKDESLYRQLDKDAIRISYSMFRNTVPEPNKTSEEELLNTPPQEKLVRNMKKHVIPGKLNPLFMYKITKKIIDTDEVVDNNSRVQRIMSNI